MTILADNSCHLKVAMDSHPKELARLNQDLEKKRLKRERLRTLDCLVLDNSLRESTVGQLRGHTLENKIAIFDEVKKCGFKHIIVASFAHMTRVDDHFLEALVKRGEDMSPLYSFSDLVCYPITGGVPDTETIPVGIAKMDQFNLKNPIFEVDLADSNVDYKIFTMENYCDILMKRIQWTFENLSKDAHIFVNLRDFPIVMMKAPERVFSLISFMASQPAKIRDHLGIIYEEPTGKYLPEEVAAWTRSVRNIMNFYNWKGRLLVHVHKKYGNAETTQLKCLKAGADGIWASVAEEGAAMGHACSSITLMNLVRMGNKIVQQKYNCTYLRTAAINITRLTTGMPPPPKQVIYGERALDLAFGFGGIAGGVMKETEFDMAEFFGEERPIRISTLASNQMIVDNLKRSFGDNPDFTLDRADKMKQLMIKDLTEGRKEEYTSKMGAAVLYDRSGGTLTAEMAEVISTTELKLQNNIKLLDGVREIWDTWDNRETERGDDRLQYDSFYNGFMSPYFSCYRCDDTRAGLKAIDMDTDGYVDWNEFCVYLKWALRQYPNLEDVDDLLSITFRKGIIPAMQDEYEKCQAS